MKDYPHAIADYLVEQYGRNGATKAAQEGTCAAHLQRDNYSLSIWREVKRILQEQKPRK